MQRIMALLEQSNNYTAIVLPPAAAGFFAFLVVSYLLKQAGTRDVVAGSYDFIPSWLLDLLIAVTLAVFSA